MGNLIFVPLSDEVLYEHPELIRGRVLAYTPDWRDQPRVGRLVTGRKPTVVHPEKFEKIREKSRAKD